MSESFHISPAAEARVAHLLATEPAGAYLRIAVDGGGCSGFQYAFSFDATPLRAEDIRVGGEAAPVVVDATSLPFVLGATLDYVETLGAAAFEIKNPNAKSSCGCGNSFSVAL